MEVQEVISHVLVIQFTEDVDNEIYDITIFKNALAKIVGESKKSGFKRLFTSEESFLLQDLLTKCTNVVQERETNN